MKKPNRSGAGQIPQDEQMRRALARRPRRGHSEVCVIFLQNYK